MKKSRYSEEQILRILQEADKDPVVEVAKRHCVSEQSIYSWRQRFAGMAADDVRKLKNLMQENARKHGWTEVTNSDKFTILSDGYFSI